MATEVEKSRYANDAHMKHDNSNDASFVETLEQAAPGYANDRGGETAKAIVEDEDSNPNIHHHVRLRPSPQTLSQASILREMESAERALC